MPADDYDKQRLLYRRINGLACGDKCPYLMKQVNLLPECRVPHQCVCSWVNRNLKRHPKNRDKWLRNRECRVLGEEPETSDILLIIW